MTGSTNIKSQLSRLWWVVAGLVGVALCLALGVEEVRADTVSTIPARVGERSLSHAGTLKLLTYNVAGVPDIVSSSNPAANTVQVSPLLNHYDIVLAQEDFVYHDRLIEWAFHRYRTSPSYARGTVLGDGLATFSKFPVRSDERVRWNRCHGYLLALSDCLAEKGFAASQLRLSHAVDIPLINLHADAGRSDGDVAARRDGFEQLTLFVLSRFRGKALIVAGDTNLDDADPRDRVILEAFTNRTGLREVCREFRCRGQNLDRVFYRSSSHVTLKPIAWRADERFVTEAGEALSDHLAMAAEFSWQSRAH